MRWSRRCADATFIAAMAALAIGAASGPALVTGPPGASAQARAATPVARAAAPGHGFAAKELPGPAVLLHPAAQPLVADCRLEAGERHGVARVLDGETLRLDDGREVRLIGALAPRAIDVGAEPGTWAPEIAAHEALAALVGGRSVELELSDRRPDRYGRLLAQVSLVEAGQRRWVQGHMLALGHARAYGLPGHLGCLDALIAEERGARDAGRGLWAHAAYRVQSTHRPRDLLRLRGTYQLVTGTILTATDIRGRLYLNFGGAWREDFTVAADGWARLRRELGIADHGALVGRRITVRGWIERRGGPFIAVQHAAQIELETSEMAFDVQPVEGDAPPAPTRPLRGAIPANPPAPPTNENRPARGVPGGLDL